MSTLTDIRPTPPRVRGARRGTRSLRALRTGRGAVGATLLVLVIGIALVGPLVAPHPIAQPVGVPGAGPGRGLLLGTDYLGRDVLSRLLHGGYPLISVAVIAVLITYFVGVSVGMAAGLCPGWIDSIIMRAVDVFMVFPPLLFLLVLLAGAGSGTQVLVIGIVFVLFPGVARIVRTATLEVSTTGYVEAAIARGEPWTAIARREVLPNVTSVLIADAGVRSLGAVFFIASLNFLGIGAQPPAANWGLMVSENRPVIVSNLWSVLAPAVLIGLLAIGANLMGDALAAEIARSGADDE